MPEMRFMVVWPDGEEEVCYSPSLVIKEHLQEGAEYPVAEFVERSRTALNIASDRVMVKYGHACSLALNQLSRIEARAARFVDDPRARVRCSTFAFD